MSSVEPHTDPAPPRRPWTVLALLGAIITFIAVWELTGSADAAAVMAVALLSIRPSDQPPS